MVSYLKHDNKMEKMETSRLKQDCTAKCFSLETCFKKVVLNETIGSCSECY